MQVDNRIFVPPLPKYDKNERGGRDHRQYHDEIGFEPVVALTFIQYHLQCAESESNETETDVVNVGFTQLAALEVWRILNKPLGQQERNDADRNVDEENPAPTEVVRDPTSKRGTDCRSHHPCDAINSKCHAPLGGSERVRKDVLLTRLQASATRALKNAEDDQHRKIERKSTQRGADGEQRNAAHVKTLAAHNRREPATQRQHDCVRNEIRGKYPRAFILTSREAAGNVRQRHVRDAGIQHLHKRGQRDR